VKTLSVREGYDRWAEVYDGDGNPLIALEERHIGRLIGEVAGLDVADVGCGTGRHALALATAGARVTALDFSRRMLEVAGTKPGAERVRFLLHDLNRPLPLADDAFDRVLCCLVAEHIPDPGALFRELARVCRRAPRGAVVFSVMHPALMLRGVQARFIDPGTGKRTQLASHPHQVTDYVRAALQAGLGIEHLSEHVADASLAAACPRAEKYVGWPMLLLMKATRQRASRRSTRSQRVWTVMSEKSAAGVIRAGSNRSSAGRASRRRSTASRVSTPSRMTAGDEKSSCERTSS